jgi:hypothetical protein
MIPGSPDRAFMSVGMGKKREKGIARPETRGKHFSQNTEFKKGIRYNLGRPRPDMEGDNSFTKRPEVREKISQAAKRNWADADYRSMILRYISPKPSTHELYLDAILQLNFPKEWQYVGDGEFWIDRKNPDFINRNGKKLIVEYNGFYTHNKEKDNAKAEHYARYGFRTLNLYPADLREDIIVEKIQQWFDEDVKWK